MNCRTKWISLVIILIFAAAAFSFSCAKEEHWGQKFDIKGSWWKKEGQSWDPKNKIFMTIGHSNPDWKDRFDARKSADLNARAEVAGFMSSLVKNYMQELRNTDYGISESIVESSSEETIIGSVIVARHYTKGKKLYQSLIKVDLKYFFDNIYDDFRKQNAARLRAKNRRMAKEDLDAKILANTEEALAKLKEMENPVVEKTLQEGGAQ